MEKEEPEEQVRLKAYSIKELAEIYDVSEKILKSWLKPFDKEIGRKVGRFYNPRQARVIFEKVGIPEITTIR